MLKVAYRIVSPTLCLFLLNLFSHCIATRKRPKFRFGSVRFGSVRFGKNFTELFVIQFHAHLQYTGIKRTDYAIFCNKSFSQSQQKEGFYIHALIL